ncbi:hypothetical protein Tco_0657775 [Tanacetum coccineum]
MKFFKDLQLIQKLRDDQKCMKKVVPSSRSKATEDIISIGSFVKVLILNQYVLVRKILGKLSKLQHEDAQNKSNIQTQAGTPPSMCQTISNIDVHVEGEQFHKSKQSSYKDGKVRNSFPRSRQSRRDLPRDNPLVSIEVLSTHNEDGNPSRANIKQALVGFNLLVHSFRALSTLRRSSLRTASAAAKPCQGDSSEVYLITGRISTVAAARQRHVNSQPHAHTSYF